jgi:hypothetical protein
VVLGVRQTREECTSQLQSVQAQMRKLQAIEAELKQRCDPTQTRERVVSSSPDNTQTQVTTHSFQRPGALAQE